MKHRAAIVVVAVLSGACGASTESARVAPTTDGQSSTTIEGSTVGGSTVGGTSEPPPTTATSGTDPASIDPESTAPAGTEPAGSDTAGTAPASTAPASTAPASTAPAGTEPPAVTLPATDPAVAPSVTPPSVGRVATASPTQGVTTADVGWALDGPWTPLATWDGAGWFSADAADGAGIVDAVAGSFPTVAVASVDLRTPLTGYRYSDASADVCADGRRGPLLDGGSGELSGDGPYSAVALGADWNVQPRGIRRSGIDSVDYQRIGESIVSAAGVDPIGGDVVEVLRADLDGNGVEEVFVTFEKITDGGGAVGDFVVIYARFPTNGGTVVDDVIFEYYPQAWTSRPTIGRAGVLAIADFNGDAIMEVVTWSKFWDTSLAELYVFDGATSLTPVALTGCSL